MNTWGRILAVGLLVMTTLVAGVAPALAAGRGETPCIGAMTNQIVRGNLVVPAEQDCELFGATVLGHVRLEYDADLEAEDTEITGDVYIGEQAGADFYHVRVGGNVDIRGTWALLDSFGDTTINGQVRVEDAERLNLSRTTVNGDLQVTGTRLMTATNSRVKGAIQVQDISFVAFRGSRLDRAVTVERAQDEARLCESSVGGDATFAGNSTKLAIGGGAYLCDGNTVRGTLAVHQNQGTITIADNIVRGDLICIGNEPAPTGSGNQVTGSKQDQCSSL